MRDEPPAPPDRPGDSGAWTLTRTWSRPRGLYGWITTTDHKELGVRFIVTALVFLVLAGTLALLMRIQLARPQNTFVGPDTYDQLFTTHGTAMMFLFAVPIMMGFGLYLVPLMVGTRAVPFPRVLNFAWWLYVFSGTLLFGGLVSNVGPDMGWFSYVPLAGPQYAPGKRMDVWSQMVTMMEISTLVCAVEIITTAFKQRAPGMSLDRIPVFVWVQVITSFMILFAMPAVMLCSSMLSADRMLNVNTQFFNPAEGGDALLWQHMFWFFAHPEVYIVFLPATAFISEIVPAFTRRPVFGYTAVVLSALSTAFLGFGVWVHHMFATPLPELGQGMFTAASLMIAIPTTVQIFCWLATLWGGRIRFDVPMLFVLGFFPVFLIGGLTGVMLGSVAIDRQVHDTFFVVAHLHYVLIGGAVFPLFGALYYWFPKFTGRMLDARMGALNFWLLFVGFNVTFFPMHLLGLHGMPRRVYTYLPETGWGPLNLLATIGAFTIALSIALFAVNALVSMRRGRVAGDDPWGAAGLEWATASPPPVYNFRWLPTVRGRYALWQGWDRAAVVTGLSAEHREVLVTTLHDAQPDHRYHVSHESILSFLAALDVGAMFTGLVFHPAALPIGLAGLAVLLTIWFWPSREPDPLPRAHDRAREGAA